MFPYASLCLLILFLGLVTSLPSWFRPSLAAVLFGVWSTLKHRIFHPVDARFFPRKCNLAKLMRWKKKKHVFHAASVFFENVLGAAGDVMFLFLQMFSVTSAPFSPYSPLMYYEWILEIVGWWHHFPIFFSWNLWESVTFNAALLSFWTTVYSFLERRD